tara:strand:- start:73 stop:516 length:444 start_codon:yes stop_codon:yes gene_type:complete
MLDALKNLFVKPVKNIEESVEHQLRLAAAALLIELVYADDEVAESELASLRLAVQQALGLSKDEVDGIVELASIAARDSISLYEFTRLINDHYSQEQKATLIESMWRIAYADGDLDKYEEHMIRNVANLIYVPHRDFIRLKKKAAGR